MNLVSITFLSSLFLFDLAIFMAEEQGEEGGSWFLHHLRTSGHHPWAAVRKGRNQEVSRTQKKAQWVFAMLWEVRRGSWTKTVHTRDRHKALACWCQKQGGTNSQWGTRCWQGQTANWICAFFLFPLPGSISTDFQVFSCYLSNKCDSTCSSVGPTFAVILCCPLHRPHSHSSGKGSRQ